MWATSLMGSTGTKRASFSHSHASITGFISRPTPPPRKQLEHPESHLMYESSGFRRMVAPHLPIKPGGKALGLTRDDDHEGWEAMAMRDELTDVMLHNAFGDAILKEVGWAGQ